MSARRWLAALLAGACLLPGAATAEPARRALVIGNSAYRLLRPLPNTLNDADDMATTLRKLGFTVVEADNADLAGFEKGLANFAATVRPGDTALVYFAGHGVTGRTAASAGDTDSYLLPTDIALKVPADVPAKSRGLATVLAALDRAQAGTRLVILDACRDNPFEANWPDEEPGAAGGLVQPVGKSLRGALVAYATSPGEFAIENSSGRNGLFTQELLKRIGAAGTPLSVTLAEVSAAVEQASQGEQIPFFVAGDTNAAALVLRPAAAGAPAVAPDPLTIDLRIQRQAVECGLPACLETGAREVRDPKLARAMLDYSNSLRGGPAGPPGAVVPAALRPPLPTGLGAEASALLTSDLADPDGARRIGRRLMIGVQGFPRDPAAAIAWYRAAADAGSGGAAFELASAYHDGLPGVAKNRVEAYRWVIEAARRKYPMAYALGGKYRLEGWGGQLKNLPAAQRWFTTGVELGDPASMVELAKLLRDEDEAQSKALYRRAAEAGMPEALFWAGYALRESNRDEAERLYRLAGERGYAWGYRNLGIDHTVPMNVARDIPKAIDWFTRAAELGDGESMWWLGTIYSDTSLNLVDCAKAEMWTRRGAVAGYWMAADRLKDGFKCPMRNAEVIR